MQILELILESFQTHNTNSISVQQSSNSKKVLIHLSPLRMLIKLSWVDSTISKINSIQIISNPLSKMEINKIITKYYHRLSRSISKELIHKYYKITFVLVTIINFSKLCCKVQL